MTVRVLFFAHLRERCGPETLLEVPAGARVADVWVALRRRYDVLATMRLRLAVNRVYVGDDHRLCAGDELALIPPVSGGAPCRERSARA